VEGISETDLVPCLFVASLLPDFSHSDVFLPMEGETSIWHLIEQFTRGIHRIAVLDQHGTDNAPHPLGTKRLTHVGADH
jgi:hypothetical protein